MVNNNDIGKIYGVSLGPGDPELITVKGLKVLKLVDKIYYPGSIGKEGGTSSYSLSILKGLNISLPKLEGFFLDMKDKRDETEMVYSKTFTRIKDDLFNGLSIAVVSEGDISFYSSFIYLLEKFRKENIPVELITGASSFLAGAAFSKIPISLQNEKVAIVPRVGNKDQLLKFVSNFETVVLIKIKSVIESIIEFLESTAIPFVYCERLGTMQEFKTSNLNNLKVREVPYFSLIIVKKHL